MRHFALLAEPATVVRRLRVLGGPEFAQQVHTDGTTVAEVADTIARSAGLAIAPSDDGPLRAWARRYATTARSIHWN